MSDGDIDRTVGRTADSNWTQHLQQGFDALNEGELSWRHKRCKVALVKQPAQAGMNPTDKKASTCRLFLRANLVSVSFF